jgi:hypothetical protein
MLASETKIICDPTNPRFGVTGCGLDKLDHDDRATDERKPTLSGFQGGVHR